MPTLKESEIKAITKLLKDSDKDTALLVEEQLRTFDSLTLKEIDRYIPISESELKESFLDLVYRIKREKLKNDFAEWKNSSVLDLEEAIFLVAEFQNPFVDKSKYKKMLDEWSAKLSAGLEEVKLEEDPSSIINEVNHFFFMELGFHGNKEDYYAEGNSLIDKVLDNKKGNPILLSIAYLLLTKRVNLVFEGVAMPAHFVVKYADTLDPIFIDPFNLGEIITLEDCKKRIEGLKLPWTKDYLVTPSNKQIIIRVLQNMSNIYQSDSEYKLKDYIDGYIETLKS